MQPYFSEKYGNPGSLHSFGQEAVAAVDKARETIAKAIGADFREITFTGSATEANNLALRGSVSRAKYLVCGMDENAKYKILDTKYKSKVIVSAIEHESVLRTAQDLKKEGVETVFLPVNRNGFVDLEKLKAALDDKTILVSVMYANNEIGTIQPISEISKLISEFRKQKAESRSDKNSSFYFLDSRFPLFHTDAVQAFQFLDCDVNKLGVDLMTLSAHKIYGPKGVGALYVRNLKHETRNSKYQFHRASTTELGQIPNSKLQIQNVSDFGFRVSDLHVISPLITGGGQEFGLRSGTENVPAIAGFGRAAELVNDSRELENKRIRELRDYFWAELKKIYPKAQVNGIMNKESGMRDEKPTVHNSSFALPNILNVYFPDYLASYLVIKLDMVGIAVSSGAACSARSSRPSHVLRALGLPIDRILRSVRFSFGKPTKIEDIKEVLTILGSLL